MSAVQFAFTRDSSFDPVKAIRFARSLQLAPHVGDANFIEKLWVTDCNE
jgi:hypothetical protein